MFLRTSPLIRTLCLLLASALCVDPACPIAREWVRPCSFSALETPRSSFFAEQALAVTLPEAGWYSLLHSDPATRRRINRDVFSAGRENPYGWLGRGWAFLLYPVSLVLQPTATHQHEQRHWKAVEKEGLELQMLPIPGPEGRGRLAPNASLGMDQPHVAVKKPPLGTGETFAHLQARLIRFLQRGYQGDLRNAALISLGSLLVWHLAPWAMVIGIWIAAFYVTHGTLRSRGDHGLIRTLRAAKTLEEIPDVLVAQLGGATPASQWKSRVLDYARAIRDADTATLRSKGQALLQLKRVQINPGGDLKTNVVYFDRGIRVVLSRLNTDHAIWAKAMTNVKNEILLRFDGQDSSGNPLTVYRCFDPARTQILRVHHGPGAQEIVDYAAALHSGNQTRISQAKQWLRKVKRFRRTTTFEHTVYLGSFYPDEAGPESAEREDADDLPADSRTGAILVKAYYANLKIGDAVWVQPIEEPNESFYLHIAAESPAIQPRRIERLFSLQATGCLLERSVPYPRGIEEVVAYAEALALGDDTSAKEEQKTAKKNLLAVGEFKVRQEKNTVHFGRTRKGGRGPTLVAAYINDLDNTKNAQVQALEDALGEVYLRFQGKRKNGSDYTVYREFRPNKSTWLVGREGRYAPGGHDLVQLACANRTKNRDPGHLWKAALLAMPPFPMEVGANGRIFAGKYTWNTETGAKVESVSISVGGLQEGTKAMVQAFENDAEPDGNTLLLVITGRNSEGQLVDATRKLDAEGAIRQAPLSAHKLLAHQVTAANQALQRNNLQPWERLAPLYMEELEDLPVYHRSAAAFLTFYRWAKEHSAALPKVWVEFQGLGFLAMDKIQPVLENSGVSTAPWQMIHVDPRHAILNAVRDKIAARSRPLFSSYQGIRSDIVFIPLRPDSAQGIFCSEPSLLRASPQSDSTARQIEYLIQVNRTLQQGHYFLFLLDGQELPPLFQHVLSDFGLETIDDYGWPVEYPPELLDQLSNTKGQIDELKRDLRGTRLVVARKTVTLTEAQIHMRRQFATSQGMLNAFKSLHRVASPVSALSFQEKAKEKPRMNVAYPAITLDQIQLPIPRKRDLELFSFIVEKLREITELLSPLERHKLAMAQAIGTFEDSEGWTAAAFHWVMGLLFGDGFPYAAVVKKFPDLIPLLEEQSMVPLFELLDLLEPDQAKKVRLGLPALRAHA